MSVSVKLEQTKNNDFDKLIYKYSCLQTKTYVPTDKNNKEHKNF